MSASRSGCGTYSPCPDPFLACVWGPHNACVRMRANVMTNMTPLFLSRPLTRVPVQSLERGVGGRALGGFRAILRSRRFRSTVARLSVLGGSLLWAHPRLNACRKTCCKAPQGSIACLSRLPPSRDEPVRLSEIHLHSGVSRTMRSCGLSHVDYTSTYPCQTLCSPERLGSYICA